MAARFVIISLVTRRAGIAARFVTLADKTYRDEKT